MATKTTEQYYAGVGRRKSAVAQVRLTPGKGVFTINGEKVTPHNEWLKPLSIVGKAESFDVSVIVRGGGFASWIDAIRLGIARALALNRRGDLLELADLDSRAYGNRNTATEKLLDAAARITDALCLVRTLRA